jgi:hypothetical protein
MSEFDELFSHLAGEPIPGGCDMCSADQILETLSPGVAILQIRHEDNCPILRASRRRAN